MKNVLLAITFANIFCIAKAQVTDTAKVSIPGTLNIVTHNYLRTATNLKVTGIIDARDFKTMRDSMPVLAILDLSDVTITAYTGSEGTQDINSYVYDDNAIPQYAFFNQFYNHGAFIYINDTTLTSIILPTKLTSIGAHAFEECKGLNESLNIPSSVRFIEEYAFQDCGFTGSLFIPSSVTNIGKSAFENCKGFTGSITISSSDTFIGESAFENCNGFCGSLIIPSSVKSIGNGSFYKCRGFTGSLTIPSSVRSIGSFAFYYCGFTGTLTLPSSLTFIGSLAFGECRFTTIINLNPVPIIGNAIGSMIFHGDSTIKTLFVPSSSVYSYQASP